MAKLLIATLTTALLSANASAAQQNCLKRDIIVAKLGERYSEQLVGRGLQNENRLFEVFVSDDGASWTIIQSFPTGISCIMAAGTNWLMPELASLSGTES